MTNSVYENDARHSCQLIRGSHLDMVSVFVQLLVFRGYLELGRELYRLADKPLEITGMGHFTG